jgi:hemerythrin-like domain-containing protein
VKPTDILVNEHRIIEQVLNCLERMVERCASEGRLAEAPAREAIDFFRAFAECAHLAKEEAHLFPLVAGTKCPRGCHPSELTTRKHQHGHTHLQAMEEAIDGAAVGEKASIKRFVQHGQDYITLLMKYIENEEDWLFPQADRVLDEAKQRSLAERLQRDESDERCGGPREQYVAIANRLADQLGVPRAELIED